MCPKNDELERLPKGTQVSQSKGVVGDPSVLKISRPPLIAETQKYVEAHLDVRPESAHQVRVTARKKNRSLRERMGAVVQKRDTVPALLPESCCRIGAGAFEPQRCATWAGEEKSVVSSQLHAS